MSAVRRRLGVFSIATVHVAVRHGREHPLFLRGVGVLFLLYTAAFIRTFLRFLRCVPGRAYGSSDRT